MDDTGAGSLKLLVARDDSNLDFVLEEYFAEDQCRRIATGVWVVHTERDCSQLREALGLRMADGLFFVVEFERWSALGSTIDTEWLLRRGH
jgi:hypothetical protein